MFVDLIELNYTDMNWIESWEVGKNYSSLVV